MAAAMTGCVFCGTPGGEANIHMDAGLFGFYPLIDRAKGMCLGEVGGDVEGGGELMWFFVIVCHHICR